MLNPTEQKTVVPEVYIPKIPRGTYQGSAVDEYWDGSEWVDESLVNAILFVGAGCLTQLTLSVSVSPC